MTDRCHYCGNETSCLTQEGFCSRCMWQVTADLDTGLRGIAAYLELVDRFRAYLTEHHYEEPMTI